MPIQLENPNKKKIPLFGRTYLARAKEHAHSRVVNMYVHKVIPDADPVYYSTPGMKSELTFTENAIRGIHRKRSNYYVVADNTFYEIDTAGTKISKGTLNTEEGDVQITSTNDEILLDDGANGYVYDITADTFTTITDTDYIAGSATLTSIFGYSVFHTGQIFYFSDQSDADSWGGSTAFATAERTQEDIEALYTFNEKMYVFGDTQTELWEVDGTTPFVTVSGISIRYGCAAPKTLSNSSERLFLLANGQNGEFGVLAIDRGYDDKIISDDIAEELADFKQNHKISDAYGFCFQYDGKEFYLLTLPGPDKTFLYDIDLEIWTELNYKEGRHLANRHIYFNNKNLVTSYADSTIYSLDRETYTDAGQTIIRKLVSPVFDTDDKVLFFDQIIINFEGGTALSSGQGSNPQAWLRKSKYGGYQWEAPRKRSLTKTGAYYNKCRWNMMGRGFRPVFELTMSDPVFWAITGSYAHVRVGIN